MSTTKRLTLTLALLLALSNSSVLLAQDATDNENQSAMPEAIVVEDVTYLGCWITDVVYEDGAEDVYDVPVSETEEPCPPGTVRHSFPTTAAEAEASGLPYVLLTGNLDADLQQVEALKASLAPAIDSQRAAVASVNAAEMLQSSCSPRSRARSVSYYAGYPDTGAGITATAYYYRSTSNCRWYLSSARDYVFDPLTSGSDLYWDEVYYDNPDGLISQWDCGCRRMNNYGTYYTSFSNWKLAINFLFEDETINDTSLGCSWWGEEYRGGVYLYE